MIFLCEQTTKISYEFTHKNGLIKNDFNTYSPNNWMVPLVPGVSIICLKNKSIYVLIYVKQKANLLNKGRPMSVCFEFTTGLLYAWKSTV